MPKFSDLYIFSDVDGTLYSHTTHEIPPRNLAAIRRFIAGGGHFALATGRPSATLLPILEEVPVNFPCICANGAAVYDPVGQKNIHTVFLPPQAEEYVRRILATYPHFDIMVAGESAYYYVSDRAKSLGKARIDRYILNENMREPITENWFKIVMFVPEADCPRHLAEIQAMQLEGVEVVSSDTYFIELLPVGASKGAALHKICELYNIPTTATIAVGDYYNDLNLLEAAGTAFAVAGAPKEVQGVADHILGSCEGGAVADLIEFLEVNRL